MAKVSFTKLTPVHKLEPIVININGNDVTIVQYLPIAEKALFAERVINNAMDPSTSFASSSRMAVYFAIELIKTYTNINLTDKLLEEPQKIYDQLVLNHILDEVIKAIPNKEYTELHNKVYEDAEHVETFVHSFVGTMQAISKDYDETSFNMESLLQTVKDPDALGTIRSILEKIG